MNGHRTLDWSVVPLGIALLTTLIPFYHGALRHLDRDYGEKERREHRSWAVLVDFTLLFLEGCAFLALAVSIGKPWLFGWILFTLLALDVGWAVLATRVLEHVPHTRPATSADAASVHLARLLCGARYLG